MKGNNVWNDWILSKEAETRLGLLCASSVWRKGYNCCFGPEIKEKEYDEGIKDMWAHCWEEETHNEGFCQVYPNRLCWSIDKLTFPKFVDRIKRYLYNNGLPFPVNGVANHMQENTRKTQISIGHDFFGSCSASVRPPVPPQPAAETVPSGVFPTERAPRTVTTPGTGWSLWCASFACLQCCALE